MIQVIMVGQILNKVLKNFIFFIYKFFLFELAREHNWSKMIESIQSYIRSLNFKYRTDLRSKKVVYENSYGEFISPHRLKVYISSFYNIKKFSFIVNRQKRSNKRNNWKICCSRCRRKTKISKYRRR